MLLAPKTQRGGGGGGEYIIRAAFRILLKGGGGGEIAVSAYQGGKRYMLYITIYIVNLKGGQTSSKGGECPLHPPKCNHDNTSERLSTGGKEREQ